MASQPRRYVSNPTLFTIDEQSTGRFQRDASLRYARGPNNSNVPNASSMDVEKCLVGPNHVDLVLKDGRTCRVQLSNQSENLDIIVRDNEKVSHAVGQWHQRMYRHEHQYHQHQHHHHPQHSSSQHNLQSIPKYHQYQAAQQQHMQQQPGHGLPWNAYNNKQLPVNKFPSSGVVVGSCQDYNGLLNRHLSRSYNAVNRLPSIDQDPLESTDSMVCAFASVATVYSTLDKQLKKPSNQELGPAKQHTAAPSSSSASKGKPLGDPASRPHHRQQGAATGVKKRNSLHDSSSSASSASSADSQTINYSPGAVAEGQHFLRIDHGDHCSGCCPDRGDHLYETIYPSGPTGIIMTGQQLDQVHKCNDSGVVSVSSDDGCSAKDVIMSASESCFDDGHPELHDDDDDDDGAVERERRSKKKRRKERGKTG
ncbi:hypothetical protein HDE_08497 [Halotydeus destructor]|nr:hypothetical protein HDE_08497 [Halotydeus destructor]